MTQYALIVSGSRYATVEHLAFIEQTLNLGLTSIGAIFVGDAKGVDSLVLDYAVARDIPSYRFTADWKKFGRSAGPRRNRQMIQTAIHCEGLTPLLITFKHPEAANVGSRSATVIAKEYGITTREFTLPIVHTAKVS